MAPLFINLGRCRQLAPLHFAAANPTWPASNFGEYSNAATGTGPDVHEYSSRNDAFRTNTSTFAELISSFQLSNITFVCSPNNPDRDVVALQTRK